MGEVVGFVGLAVVFAAVVYVLMRLAARVRRRGIGGAIVGPAEEIWHPNAREYRFVVEAEARRGVPTPPAGDRPGGDPR